MRTRLEPLLAELHAHTRWSDGELTTRELVDLYGRQGFDVLCITDHVVRGDRPVEADGGRAEAVSQRDYPAYLAEVAVEALRARAVYGLLVLPGLELTYNDTDPAAAAHAVAVGLREFVSVDGGIEEALRTARVAGAATIAAHPYDVEPDAGALRPRCASRVSPGSLTSSTGTSSSTGQSSSRGLRTQGCRSSPPAIRTSRSISTVGRRCCRAPATSRRSSTTFARRDRCT
jgi:PHP domain-containing protein